MIWIARDLPVTILLLSETVDTLGDYISCCNFCLPRHVDKEYSGPFVSSVNSIDLNPSFRFARRGQKNGLRNLDTVLTRHWG